METPGKYLRKCDFLMKGDRIAFVFSEVGDASIFEQFEINNQPFVKNYSTDLHRTCMQDSNCVHISVVTIDDREIVGHILLFGLSRADKSIELRRIVIEQKGCGFGRESLKLIIKYCFEQLEAQTLWLDVYSDNARAIHLYESLGFLKYDTVDMYKDQEKTRRKLLLYRIVKNGSK